MRRCLITYSPIDQGYYSEKGLRQLSPSLKALSVLDYSSEELRAEAMQRASKMSIQGIQPKLSAVLNVRQGCFEIVDKGGRYILKPQHPVFPELPQNEDMTMHLAGSIGIDVPVHGLIYGKDGTLTYFIKRFDRRGQKDKTAVEDFAQLAGMSRDTKYNYSMERLAGLIDRNCTFPAVEKARLFKLVIFNYLIGNEDMHLKNYSVIIRNGKVELSPAYDLLNSTIALSGTAEEIALPLQGKKANLNRTILVDYFGGERCGLTSKVIESTLETIREKLPYWFELIDISSLSDGMKEKYRELLTRRIAKLEL